MWSGASPCAAIPAPAPDPGQRRRRISADPLPIDKDAFHEHVIAGKKAAVNPQQTGTKAAAHYQLNVPAGGSARVRVRLSNVGQASRLPAERVSASGPRSNSSTPLREARAGGTPALPSADFDSILARHRREADEFYAGLQKDITDADARHVQPQAFAGMIWSKQFFYSGTGAVRQTRIPKGFRHLSPGLARQRRAYPGKPIRLLHNPEWVEAGEFKTRRSPGSLRELQNAPPPGSPPPQAPDENGVPCGHGAQGASSGAGPARGVAPGSRPARGKQGSR